ncbi:hypothetical protein BGW80DRAFT_260628 [Lactifluus volemus]|nr:hypothetical protein BGW80DRAFT_260628 [Lactifluus volemus]
MPVMIATALGSSYQAGVLYRSDLASFKSYQPSSLAGSFSLCCTARALTSPPSARLEDESLSDLDHQSREWIATQVRTHLRLPELFSVVVSLALGA